MRSPGAPPCSVPAWDLSSARAARLGTAPRPTALDTKHAGRLSHVRQTDRYCRGALPESGRRPEPFLGLPLLPNRSDATAMIRARLDLALIGVGTDGLRQNGASIQRTW